MKKRQACQHVWSDWKDAAEIRPPRPVQGKAVWIRCDSTRFCVRLCGARRLDQLRCDLRNCGQGCIERFPLPGDRELTICDSFGMAHLMHWPDYGYGVAVAVNDFELEALREEPEKILAIVSREVDSSNVTAR